MSHRLATICLTLLLAAGTLSVSHAATPEKQRFAPLQGESGCAAPMPGWQLNDYIARCAQLITQLEDTRTRCGRIGVPPSIPVDRADPQGLCSQQNQSIIADQIAAAHNDRAYFFILCKGTANIQLAIKDLKRALELLPNYWLAHRNLGVAYLLLADFEKAKYSFTTVVTASMATDPSGTLVRTVTQAEARLGLGYAHLGLCDITNADDQLFESERLALGPIGSDVWIRAAAMFGQGLGMKARGAMQARTAATSKAVTPSDKGRLQRDAERLTGQGDAKMNAARALVSSIDSDIRERFYIDEPFIVGKCRSVGATA